ncbi:hypothetical protein DL240_07685 [Lujinxingia litoralis]|uniref:Uncharacterized protein n=2 Tax=Lujinxingia litoralis TaxID=2211119 RepID=A0A328C6V2_9DELT|nr:hypothetical protein DL240_07685 [Lujinxingia litoralis]
MTRDALRPMVCESSPTLTNELRAQIIVEHELQRALTLAELDAHEFWAMHESEDTLPEERTDEEVVGDEAVGDASEEAAEPEAVASAQTRRLERKAPQPDAQASLREREPIDPFVAQARVDLESDAERSRFASQYGTSPDAEALAFTGSFVRDQEGGAAIYTPGQDLKFYKEGRVHARLNLDHTLSEEVDWEGITELRAGALRVVNDGTLQILLPYAVSRGDEGGRDYYVGIYKVIGDFVGKIFEQRIAHQPSADADVQILGAITFLHGDEHPAISWAPLSAADGDTAEPEVLQWNHWEGVFRVPVPPPTAPRPRS